MYKSVFSFISICFILSGCLSTRPEQHQFEINRLKTDIARTMVRVTVDKEEIPLDGSSEEALLQKAESKGMDNIFKKWLNSGFIFQTSDCPVSKRSQDSLILREDQFSAQFDEMSNSYSFRFRIESEFRSCRHLSGRIVRLSDRKYIISQNQEATLKFNEMLPDVRSGYFLVARQDSVQDVEVLHLIGGGKILDVFGRLASGRIKKAYREIKAGDLVYLLKTSIEPVEAEDKPDRLPESTPLSDVDEVVVQPGQAPRTKEMPAEPK
ncbi:MAG: hypothetical protein K9K64_04400 [Desulfohalobiaceae bacterium]|nr:hypothetical protein [Desulfohalobiaceae bacterium]